MDTTKNKLKILCLHGINNNIGSFTFMTKGFRDLFSEVADFYFLDGPFDIDAKTFPPEPVFIAKGFQPPFKEWFYRLPKDDLT